MSAQQMLLEGAVGGGAAFDFYISPTGSDANVGTSVAAPWAITSLKDNNGNNSKIAGKKVGLIAGTYPTSGLNSGNGSGNFQYPKLHLPPGSLGSPTYVASCNSTGVYTRGVAILDDSTSASVNPIIGQDPTGNGFWTIDGLTIKANGTNNQATFMVCGRYALNTTGASNSATNIIIQNCEIYNLVDTLGGGRNTGGIIFQGVTGGIVQFNYIHDINSTADAHHCHGYEEYSSLDTIVQYNTFAHCPIGAIDSKQGNSGINVQYNYFYACGTGTIGNGTGTITGCDGTSGDPNSPGTTNQIHHNVFDGCGQEMTTDVNNVRGQSLNAYNNTVYDTLSGNVNFDHRTQSGAQIQFYNNIAYFTANGGGGTYGLLALTAGSWSSVNYNDYFLSSYSGAWGQSGTTYSSLAAWKASSGSPDANSLTSNPTFTSSITPGGGPTQFQLGSGSPCLNAGKTGGTSGGTTVNMGAWDGVVTQIGANWVSYPLP